LNYTRTIWCRDTILMPWVVWQLLLAALSAEGMDKA